MRVSPELEARILELAGISPQPAWTAPVKVSEAEFQQAITDFADEHGWAWHHQTISKRSKAGWPDLPLFRERAVYIEVKDENGQLTADQCRWRDILLAAGQEYYVFRPSDWAKVVEVLS